MLCMVYTTMLTSHDTILTLPQVKIDNAMSALDGTRRMTFRDQGSCSGGGVGRVMASHELHEVRFAFGD